MHRTDRKSEVRVRKEGKGGRLGGMKYEVRGEEREESQRGVRMLRVQRDSGQSGLGDVRVGETVEGVYNYFVDRIHMGQAASIPYKTMSSQKDKPKFLSLQGTKKEYVSEVKNRWRGFKATI